MLKAPAHWERLKHPEADSSTKLTCLVPQDETGSKITKRTRKDIAEVQVEQRIILIFAPT